jgi:hypothetical protein
LAGAQEGFWGYIHELYARVAGSAPAGKHAVVEIETQDGRTIEPRAVQVYPPFLICDLGGPEPEILALQETDIRRVRIYETGEDEKIAVGFRVGEIELEKPPGD